ncbi:hypothetical protein SNOG_08198 [Parastagonospora nodorum SN15]|uniref:Uncharacterized protein n=1 Tax=Phaeosphaeria nodorum (strain SN15 / ATCC MYA-4574 / FGSC 10173) TaxID=321614 RepID=Q0UJ66_PHANO|nr:hypothetical protein SNOG_08198 [Parastagonospora nodorum SN15]EAT84474.1 hypothetical protein SNOG_08198 [Parastagonospora nodorum SN15]
MTLECDRDSVLMIARFSSDVALLCERKAK